MTYASRILLLISSNILYSFTAIAGPLTDQDIKAEQQLLTGYVCRDKSQASQDMWAFPALAKKAAVSGCAVVCNKLTQLDYTQVIIPLTVNLNSLSPALTSPTNFLRGNTYLCHRPVSSFTCFAVPAGFKSPEKYIPAVPDGANLMTQLGTLSIPNCLSPPEVEDYIHIRLELGLHTGAYWDQLNKNKLSLSQLAALRYYDYLDTFATKQPVAVFRCTEYIAR